MGRRGSCQAAFADRRSGSSSDASDSTRAANNAIVGLSTSALIGSCRPSVSSIAVITFVAATESPPREKKSSLRSIAPRSSASCQIFYNCRSISTRDA
jgi:hypothetical protein